MHDPTPFSRCCSATLVGLLGSLSVACSANPDAKSVDRQSAHPAAEQATQAGMESSSDRVAVAEVAQAPPKSVPCPSHDFEEFLKLFANQGDVRQAYTARPWKAITPYYWAHDSMPGDPRFPKWNEQLVTGPAESKIGFDEERNIYVSVEHVVAPGEILVPHNGNNSHAALENFSIRKISDLRHEVQIGRGIIDVYEYRDGCWYYTEGWDRSEENVVNCKWPDECRGILEREEIEED